MGDEAEAAAARHRRFFERLDLHAPKIPVQSSLSLRSYYQRAAELRQQAKVYLEEGDDVRAYVTVKRFLNLVLHTVAQHLEIASKAFAVERRLFRRECAEMMDRLEEVKGRVKASIDAGELLLPDGEEDDGAAARGGGGGDGGEQQQQQQQQPQQPQQPQQYQMREQDEEQDQRETDASAPPGPYRRQRSWDILRLPGATGPQVGQGGPQPPASAAASAAAATSSARRGGGGGGARANPQAGGVSAVGLRRVRVPAGVSQAFLAYVEANTRQNRETCGVLAGRLRGGELVVTHVILPPQEGTSNTVMTSDEECLFEYQISNDLLTIGWIHTHPRQECFLSSVDLHMQHSYQMMMPEALAIVCAPTQNPNSGTFSLTPNGLGVLAACSARGFHRHSENEALYIHATHVAWDRDRRCEFVDLRPRGKSAQQQQQQQPHHYHYHHHHGTPMATAPPPP